jgi:hypothetical protein
MYRNGGGIMRTGQWKGKVKFEDCVTSQLFQINENLEKTNRLLSKLIGDDSLSEDKSTLGEMIDTAKDLLDNGKRDHSNVKKRSKKGRK